MSRRRYSMKRRQQQRRQPHRDHQRARRDGARIGGEQHLEAQHGIERHVEQQARQHGRDRRRALGMRVGQPGMERRQPDLGAVADQQEDEGEVEQRRIERAPTAPRSAVHAIASSAVAHHRLRREIDEDRAEQRQRDADAARG